MKFNINYILFFLTTLIFPFLLGFNLIENSNELIVESSSKKRIRSLLSKMIYIEGNTFTQGIIADPDLKMTASDSTLFSAGIPKRSSVDSYYMCATEVTNLEWREFYQDKVAELGEVAGKRRYYPDTALWIKEFPYSYNKPMAQQYFSNPKFNDYPVVGISWDQANAYCLWKSEILKALLAEIGIQFQIQFRLPTGAEWEYAASKKLKKMIDLKEMAYVWSEEDRLRNINNLTNIGPIKDINNVILKNYGDDGCLYTCKVASYPPNSKGLFDMGGNVSEWTSDQGYVESHDFENDILIRLESWSAVEKEIEKQQQKLTAGDQASAMYLKWLTHDRNVLKQKNTKICKGGNWVNGMIYTLIGSRQGINKDKPSTKLGFRIAISNVDQDIIKYFPRKNWRPGK